LLNRPFSPQLQMSNMLIAILLGSSLKRRQHWGTCWRVRFVLCSLFLKLRLNFYIKNLDYLFFKHLTARFLSNLIKEVQRYLLIVVNYCKKLNWIQINIFLDIPLSKRQIKIQIKLSKLDQAANVLMECTLNTILRPKYLKFIVSILLFLSQLKEKFKPL
jgi:hypothetical protein